MTETPQTTSAAIAINSLSYCYPGASPSSVFQLDDWQVMRGERVFLHGASGSGKTTLLNLLAGILTPQQGEVTLLGQPFSNLSARKRDKFRAQHIGVVFQQFNLIPYLSVLHNIQLASYFAKNSTEATQRKAAELIERLQLPADTLLRQASDLSVGQQQRVAIARALINEPEILLVDEPTSALDAAARDAFMEILNQVCAHANTTMLFVSHDMGLQSYFEHSVNIASLRTTSEAAQC